MKIRTLSAGSLALILFSPVNSEEASIATLPASAVKTTPNQARYRERVGNGPFGTVTLPARMIMEHYLVIRMKE